MILFSQFEIYIFSVFVSYYIISIEISTGGKTKQQKNKKFSFFCSSFIIPVTKRYYRIKGNYFLLCLFKSKVSVRKRNFAIWFGMEKSWSINDIISVWKTVYTQTIEHKRHVHLYQKRHVLFSNRSNYGSKVLFFAWVIAFRVEVSLYFAL